MQLIYKTQGNRSVTELHSGAFIFQFWEEVIHFSCEWKVTISKRLNNTSFCGSKATLTELMDGDTWRCTVVTIRTILEGGS